MKIHQISIDLTKIDKARIKPHANGSLYYELSIIENDEPNQYGQTLSVCTAQTKEEREAKVQRVYCGNGKTVWNSDGTTTPAAKPANSTTPPQEFNDLPF